MTLSGKVFCVCTENLCRVYENIHRNVFPKLLFIKEFLDEFILHFIPLRCWIRSSCKASVTDLESPHICFKVSGRFKRKKRRKFSAYFLTEICGFSTWWHFMPIRKQFSFKLNFDKAQACDEVWLMGKLGKSWPFNFDRWRNYRNWGWWNNWKIFVYFEQNLSVWNSKTNWTILIFRN